ncbi:MAG: hypothetical protein Q8O52_29965 [Sulfuritalea sp.]|nr:hypothetical protein [Sulfuritalea sp.]
MKFWVTQSIEGSELTGGYPKTCASGQVFAENCQKLHSRLSMTMLE